MAPRTISSGRKLVFTAGLLLLIGGILMLGAALLMLTINVGHDIRDLFIITGLGMFLAGNVVMRLGRRGLAGSGLVLDPERARRDLEPWSRMAGGMVQDALDESGIAAGNRGAAPGFADKLRDLHALREEGILTEEEYQREKAEVLREN
jgi:hypothetical protein